MTHLDRLDAYLAANDLEAVWFARPPSFAWLTGGGNNVVDSRSDVGVAAAGYDGEEVTVVTDNIEAGRLRDEELRGDERVVTVDWYADSLADAVARETPTPAGADFPVPGLSTVAATDLRQPLTDGDVETYRELGRDAAEALETALERTQPRMTEWEVAAEMQRELTARGIEAPVALVGGSERAPKYRHYTTTDAAVGDYALASVTATRDGLFASCTRTVAFDAPEWLAERTEKAARVEATALAATRAVGLEGGTAGDVFEAVQDAYAGVGYDGEWELHHQGGAAGYSGREWIATPTSDATVYLPMAYAWNPTVQGAKSEDTWLVGEGEGDFECLTAGDWPTVEAEAVDRDLTLSRPTVRHL
ncbi:MAG: M24 family metallopeptidase [Halobacteriaceae archaeon]